LEPIEFDVPTIRKKIEDAFATTIAASARTFQLQKNHQVSFELFGFDVLIDSDQNKLRTLQWVQELKSIGMLSSRYGEICLIWC
jgi:hypothetical protein